MPKYLVVSVLLSLATSGSNLATETSPASSKTSTLSGEAAETNEQGLTVVASGRLDLAVLRGESPLLVLRTQVHGPGFKRTRVEGVPIVKGNARTYTGKIVFYKDWARVDEPFGGAIEISHTMSRTGTTLVELTYVCRPEQDVQFTNPTARIDEARVWLGPVLPASKYFDGGSCVIETADGKWEEISLPPSQGNTGKTKQISLRPRDGPAISLEFDPPVQCHRDHKELRFWLESPGVVRGGQTYAQKITLRLPKVGSFEPDSRWVDNSDWFEIDVENNSTAPSVIGMQDWQDKPAGAHGFAQMKEDRLVFQDGTPVKFWGVNSATDALDQQTLDRWAATLAKFGVNIVRTVFFGRPNYKGDWNHYVKLQDTQDGMQFDADSLRLFDYGFAKFKEHGIYSGFAPFWGWFPTPADKKRLINYEELMGILRQDVPAEIQGSFYGLSCLAPDLQDLMIGFHVQLLNHVNPHTGKRYADDPALAYVELQNEDNAYLGLFRLEQKLACCPTYRSRFYRCFAEWLKTKYATQEALAKAWKSELANSEQLEQANITPLPKYFRRPTPRIADQMAFIYETQRDFYAKFAQAVRQTGYQGLLVGSNWQASNWLGHLYNVKSDWDIGFIDRHNYSRVSLQEPGAGLMSCGLQAVRDRPFSFSEWAGSCGVGMQLDVPMVAVYGMGLQGWDMSMQFAWQEAGIMPYETDLFASCNGFRSLCQYPALARSVRRGDVREGAVVGSRRISVPAMIEKGDVGFEEEFSLLGAGNLKNFNASVPQKALVAGRVVLEFVDGPVEQPTADDSAPYFDHPTGAVRSTTGQLFWDASGPGFFTVNTPGTKAVVGYGGRRAHKLGEVTIEPQTRFGSIYVTALDAGETVADAKRLLITTVARMVDKGTVFDELADEPLKSPKSKVGPLLIEPVTARIELKGRKSSRVYALDHDGRKPVDAAAIPVEQTKDALVFTVDGRRSKAVYYLVEVLEE